MASSSSILTSPKQKNSPSIDAVLGNDDPVTEILLRVPAKAVLRLKWDLPERSQPINYIFNPTTRQFAMLPPPPDDGQFFDSIQLVFDPSESSCYRVVCTQFFTSELKIYVYLSETKDWKLALREPRKF
ncbi:hypothetical protein NC652_000228 [Populus alba x Populus x berolinensis]|nr:hypothetical protein NC652_000228 [Populus alba x Populus x berolinensis]